jgi:hypothetical protein
VTGKPNQFLNGHCTEEIGVKKKEMHTRMIVVEKENRKSLNY